MKSRAPKKPITQMTTEELARETAEFEREFVADSFVEPGPAARTEWNQAKRKQGKSLPPDLAT